MICHNCTTSNADTSGFCAGCGSDLGEITRQSKPHPQQPALAGTVTDSLHDSIIAGKYRLEAKLVHDFGVPGDGVQYLVMELVEVESLRNIIKRQGPLTPSASVEIVDQVCAALDEAVV